MGLDTEMCADVLKTRSLRILYINHALARFDSEPGTWARLLVQQLRGAGADLATYPSQPDAMHDAPEPAGLRPASASRKYLRSRMPRRLALLLIDWFLFLRGVKRAIQTTLHLWRNRADFDVDVVLARAYEYEWTPWCAARMLRKPFVLEVHAPFYLERRLRGRGHSPWLRRLEQFQWRRAAGIWVNSRELVRLMRENGVADERIMRIPHGVDLDRFRRSPGSVPRDTVEVAFVGSFYPWHGVLALIEALARVRSRAPMLRLRLIGDGIERPAAEALVRRLGVGDVVTFTGWVGYETLIETLCRSDIGVAPFLKLEPFYFDPVKIVDYMAAELAVVASRLGGISETLANGRCGVLVEPGDAEALGDALVELAHDASRRERLGAAARRRLAEEQTWAVTSCRILALCREARDRAV